MITGTLKNNIDAVWDTFWSGGISNPMNVIEQFTYLLFLRQLDMQQDVIDQKKLLGVKVPDQENLFDERHEDLRWKNLMQLGSSEVLHSKVRDEVFPFLKSLGDGGMAKHLKSITFGIDSPSTLHKAMQQIDVIDFRNRDIAGDLYEYMLSKLSASGTNGQFRTPQHIIKLLVAMMEPTVEDTIIDPACGTAGFLVNATEWVKQHHEQDLYVPEKREKFFSGTFYGFDFDASMVRIAAMNSFMHGFKNPNIAYRDSLGELPHDEAEFYSLVLANPPFAGSLDPERVDPAVRKIADSKKTELLFISRFLTLLKVGGRAAVIVPEGVLFGSTKAHKALRQELVENQKLDAVIKLPSGVFKPYSGVSTAVLCFTKTNTGGTDCVWFYEMLADGFSLDDKRTPLLDMNLLGPVPTEMQEDSAQSAAPVELNEEQLAKNNLPDLLARFRNRNSEEERNRPRTAQSFSVPIDDIREANYELSMNRFKEITFEQEETREPQEILDEIAALDLEINEAMAKLRSVLGDDRG